MSSVQIRVFDGAQERITMRCIVCQETHNVVVWSLDLDTLIKQCEAFKKLHEDCKEQA